jgi:hypothetical protein
MSGVDDQQIWDYARDQGSAIASKDMDFRERSYVEGAPPRLCGWTFRLRVATPDANPDLALAAVKTVSQWKLTPLRFRSEFLTRYVSCNGEGDVQDFQGTITFDSPSA